MEYNDFRADAEAQNIARTGFLGGKDGAMADEAIGRIGEIRRLGAAGSLGDGANPGDSPRATRNLPECRRDR